MFCRFGYNTASRADSLFMESAREASRYFGADQKRLSVNSLNSGFLLYR